MSVIRKSSKKQYVEHTEEHVGEEMTPFVALLVEENQMKKSLKQQQSVDATATKLSANTNAKKKLPFWKRVSALFS